MTPDSRPLLGEIPGVDGLFVCAGFSGMGFKISPAIGQVMSELLLDGCGETIDISPFRLSRFAEGLPIKAEYEYKDDWVCGAAVPVAISTGWAKGRAPHESS